MATRYLSASGLEINNLKLTRVVTNGPDNYVTSFGCKESHFVFVQKLPYLWFWMVELIPVVRSGNSERRLHSLEKRGGSETIICPMMSHNHNIYF